MGNSWAKVDFTQIHEFGDKLEQLAGEVREAFFQSAAKELAARLLALVIDRTPSDTGELRRGWTGGVDMNPQQFAEALTIEQRGDTYIITIANEVDHAIYVEFGHRTKPGKDGSRGFVEGQLMLEISMQELDSRSRDVLDEKLSNWLKGVFA